MTDVVLSTVYLLLLLDLSMSFPTETQSARKVPIKEITPFPCEKAETKEQGVCMFAWHCRNIQGKHLKACFDGIFVGSCCQLPPGVITTAPSEETNSLDEGDNGSESDVANSEPNNHLGPLGHPDDNSPPSNRPVTPGSFVEISVTSKPTQKPDNSVANRVNDTEAPVRIKPTPQSPLVSLPSVTMQTVTSTSIVTSYPDATSPTTTPPPRSTGRPTVDATTNVPSVSPITTKPLTSKKPVYTRVTTPKPNATAATPAAKPTDNFITTKPTLKPSTAKPLTTTPKKPTRKPPPTKRPTTTTRRPTTRRPPTTKKPSSTKRPTTTKRPVTTKKPTAKPTIRPTTPQFIEATEKITTVSPSTSSPNATLVIEITDKPSNTTEMPIASANSTSSTPINGTTTVAPRPTNSTYKDICGRPVMAPQGRIVGGENAHYGEWPWMISLRQWKKNTFLHKCGAALLNEIWAITAAHCVENVSPTDLLLRLGEFDVSSDKEPETFEERRVQIVASHPKFDPRTFEYDLALLRFYEPVKFRRNIIPVCIAEVEEDYVGKVATVTGWGRLYEDGPLPHVLQKVHVPIITNKECESMYRKAGFVEDIPDIFICAGIKEGGKDSCEGDSGGPMVLRSEGKWVLAGIISWGIGCAIPSQPGVYTRISKFASWIDQIIAF